MDDTAAPLIPAPRHLRKRALHPDIADTLFVSREPAAAAARGRAANSPRQKTIQPAQGTARGNRRAVALALMILASLSMAALTLALIFIK